MAKVLVPCPWLEVDSGWSCPFLTLSCVLPDRPVERYCQYYQWTLLQQCMRPMLSIYNFENPWQFPQAKMVSKRGILRICAGSWVLIFSSLFVLWSYALELAGSRWGEAPGTGRSVGHRERLRQERSSQEPVRSVAAALRRWACLWATDEETDLGHFGESIVSLSKRCLW